jgi:hypothetical protein
MTLFQLPGVTIRGWPNSAINVTLLELPEMFEPEFQLGAAKRT